MDVQVEVRGVRREKNQQRGRDEQPHQQHEGICRIGGAFPLHPRHRGCRATKTREARPSSELHLRQRPPRSRLLGRYRNSVEYSLSNMFCPTSKCMFETPVVFLVKQYVDSRTATCLTTCLSLTLHYSSNPGPSHCREPRCIQGLQMRRVRQRTLSRRLAPGTRRGAWASAAASSRGILVAESCRILRRV